MSIIYCIYSDSSNRVCPLGCRCLGKYEGDEASIILMLWIVN